ncbi:rubrerythrin [Rhodoblastus acidophilus]|nr:ferritin family protein [Rhodoblastus acidophilus]MCW2275551.1 rubrerythrin [Rhodoblastus acidophilus]
MRQLKTLIVLAGLAAASALACGSANAEQLSPQAREALREAMHNEAFASAKYKLFSEHARRAGKTELADLLAKNANIEYGHFLRWSALYGLVRDDSENLKAAIDGEGDDDIKLYTRLATEAAARGETTLANHFNEIKAQEEKHQKELDKVVEKTFKPN